MSILNERIKQRREALGMSQAELAELLGYSDRSTIAKIEKGTNDITQSKIEAFAKALRTTPAYLMGWENDSGEQDLELTALDVAKWLEVSPDAVESVMEEMGWPDPTKPEVLSKISAEVERRKIYSVGHRIKEARKKVGLTQKELGDRCGMADSAIRRYESDRGNPTQKALERIAAALGVTVDFLLTGEKGEKHPLAWTRNLNSKLNIVGCFLESTELILGAFSDEDNEKWIRFPDCLLMLSDEELKNLDNETDSYLRFKLQELREMHKGRIKPPYWPLSEPLTADQLKADPDDDE